MLFFAMGIGGFAQQDLDALMRSRGEYYFTLSLSQPEDIANLSRLCSVDGTDGNTVVCYANIEEYEKLLSLGYQPVLQTPPSLRAGVTMWDGIGTYNWDAYLTYGQYTNMMAGFPSAAAAQGRSCTLLDLGTLSSGRKILGVRLNKGQPEGKPKFLYSSTMHGDEITGMILMLRLIDELCTSTDAQVANLVDSLDIYIFPCTNPDGTYYRDNNTVSGARRYNGHNKDLNRHFPDFVYGAHPDGASSYELEAQWMMDLAQENLFTMGANYHGGAEVVNYPYDCSYSLTADNDWWQMVSLEYANLCKSVYTYYMTDVTSNGIVRGSQWYIISGGRQDYMNYYAQCRELTVECSTPKTPAASQLPVYWNYNHAAMLAYMGQCLKGIHGFVYDAVTGEPVVGAEVFVQNHDSRNSQVTSHAAGDFHRPIKGGTYTIVVSKEGYFPQTIEVTVADGQRLDLDNIYLVPETQSISLSAGWIWWSTYFNLNLAHLEEALGGNALHIVSQNGSASYLPDYGWDGSLTELEPSKMYMIEISTPCTLSLSGTPVNLSECPISLNPGYTWIGYPLAQSMSVNEALSGLTPAVGDVIKSQNGMAMYTGISWQGTLTHLEPGKGYIYKSNATTDKTFTYPSLSK